MSSIIEFFVAAGDDEAAGTVEDGPDESFETASYGDFDAWSSVEEWESLLTGRDGGGPELIAGDEEEPLVLRVPPALTAALARAGDEALTDLTARWLDLRAEQGEEIDEMLAAELVSEVATLATDAVRTNASLYCWIG